MDHKAVRPSKTIQSLYIFLLYHHCRYGRN